MIIDFENSNSFKVKFYILFLKLKWKIFCRCDHLYLPWEGRSHSYYDTNVGIIYGEESFCHICNFRELPIFRKCL